MATGNATQRVFMIDCGERRRYQQAQQAQQPAGLQREHSFWNLGDALAMRPIYQSVEARGQAHTFVAALALGVQRFLEKRLQQTALDLSGRHALQAVASIRPAELKLDRA